MKRLVVCAVLLLLFTSICIPAQIGGRIAPDGSTAIHIDLPGELHRKNTASRGLGLCVFTSIHHASLWQDVPALHEFPQYLIDRNIAGGGYPSKVDKLIPKAAAAKSLPTPEYIQVQSRDLEILKLACRTSRMPSVTYCWSPTGRYSGRRIAHMVNLSHADDRWFCVLDNNYPGLTSYEWMTPAEFLRSYACGSGPGWAVILLDPGPPPVPIETKS